MRIRTSDSLKNCLISHSTSVFILISIGIIFRFINLLINSTIYNKLQIYELLIDNLSCTRYIDLDYELNIQSIDKYWDSQYIYLVVIIIILSISHMFGIVRNTRTFQTILGMFVGGQVTGSFIIKIYRICISIEHLENVKGIYKSCLMIRN